MINDATYFRMLKHERETGVIEDQAECWREVAAEIDAVLKHRHAG